MNKNSAKIAILTCALLGLSGCGHGSEEHGHAEHQADHGNHGSELQLALDNGNKWPVDEHTRATAARIAERVDGSATIDSIEDARALAVKLDEELDVLVKGCTMTGAAHDQLHVFLVALFPQVEALQEKTDLKDLERARAEIGSLLEAYEKHFE